MKNLKKQQQQVVVPQALDKVEITTTNSHEYDGYQMNHQAPPRHTVIEGVDNFNHEVGEDQDGDAVSDSLLISDDGNRLRKRSSSRSSAKARPLEVSRGRTLASVSPSSSLMTKRSIG